MKVGDLVRVKPQVPGGTPMVEEDWIGIVTDFRIDDDEDSYGSRYVLVFWSEQYSQEEEYLDQLEVISASR